MMVELLACELWAQGTWGTKASLPAGRQEVGVALVAGKIYVIGGFDASAASVNTVERYDPVLDEWESIDPIPAPSPLNHVGAAEVGGKLFVIGGLHPPGFMPTDSVYCYDPFNEEWSPKANMPTARGAMGVAVIDGKIYAAGGLLSARSNDMAVYDPDMNEWTPLAPMPTARDHLAAVAYQGKFYAFGGRFMGQLRNTVEIYNPLTNTWTAGAPLPTARAGIAAAQVDGRAYIFGGEGRPRDEDPNGIFHETEEYDIVKNEWRAMTPMPTGLHGIGAAVLGRRIHIPGGGPIEGLGVTTLHQTFTPPAPNSAGHWKNY